MLYCGRCNNHLLLADVIAKCMMADVFAKLLNQSLKFIIKI